jgi:hypothetical protein
MFPEWSRPSNALTTTPAPSRARSDAPRRAQTARGRSARSSGPNPPSHPLQILRVLRFPPVSSVRDPSSSTHQQASEFHLEIQHGHSPSTISYESVYCSLPNYRALPSRKPGRWRLDR